MMRMRDYAFPRPFSPAYSEQQHGMTLRDWFAGQALARLVSGAEGPQLDTWDHLAAASYDAADAMLRARARPTEEPQP